MTLAILTVNRGRIAVFTRLAGAVLAFAAQVTVARIAGIAEFGSFAFVVGAINLCVAISKLGLDTAALRFEALYLGNREFSRYRGFRRYADGLALLSSLAVAAIAAYVVSGSDPWTGKSTTLLMTVILIAVPCISLSALRISSLLALGEVFLAYIPELMLRPVTIITGCLILAGTTGHLNAEQALSVFGVAATLSLIFSTASTRLRTPEGISLSREVDYSMRSWSDASLTFLASTVVYFGLTQVDILIVGYLLGDAAVGGYAAAARCAVYLTLFLVAVQRTVAPLISEHYARRDREDTQRILDVIAAAGGVPGLAAGILVFVFAEPVMRLFGEGFGEAAVLLRILAVGQVVNCLTGASGVTMNMTGHHRAALVIQLSFLVFGVAGTIVAAKYFGIAGVACVTAATVSGWNLVSVWYVRHTTGLKTWFRYEALLVALNALRDRAKDVGKGGRD